MDSTIGINIWDDYYDDGYVPEGERQETYIYVESGPLSQDECRACLESLLQQIQQSPSLGSASFAIKLHDSRELYPNLDEKFHFSRWEIRVFDLSHASREALVDELQAANLTFNGFPMEVYSES